MPTKRRTTLLACAACAALAVIPVLAHADQVSCSSASQWSSDTHYKQDDRVWYYITGSSSSSLYSCDKESCYGSDNKPQSSSTATWRLVGACKELSLR